MTTSTELLHYQTSVFDKFHHFYDVTGQTILEIVGLPLTQSRMIMPGYKLYLGKISV